MANTVGWGEFSRSAPELANTAAARFLVHPHHVVATVGVDGRPRVWGTNVYLSGGELWFGSMPGAARTRDITRDARIAIHSAPLSEDLEGGDAKIEGVARILPSEESARWMSDHLDLPEGTERPSGDVAVVSISRVTLTTIDSGQLVVSTWIPTGGLRIVSRA